MTPRMKQLLIVFCTFIGGFYFFLEFVLPGNIDGFEFGAYHDVITRGVILVGSMAIGLGIINLVRVHGLYILKGRKGWLNSIALLGGMFLAFGLEGADFLTSERRASEMQELSLLKNYLRKIKSDYDENKTPPQERVLLASNELSRIQKSIENPESFFFVKEQNRAELRATFSKALTQLKALNRTYTLTASDAVLNATQNNTIQALIQLEGSMRDVAEANYEETIGKRSSEFVAEAFFFPLGAAMFSLLAFYVASASYRAFRLRSVEAGIMMAAAILVMLGQIPFGPLYISEDLPAIRFWLMTVINTPAFRAIFFGSAVAALAMSIRIWLSLEKSPLSADDEGAG